MAAASVAAGSLASSVFLSLIWLTTPDSYLLVAVTTAVPYALPGYLLALVLVALLRRGTVGPVRRWLGLCLAVAVLGTAFQAVLLAPAYVGARASGRPDLTVMTLNLRKGGADPHQAFALVAREHVGVLVTEETTAAEYRRLVAAGIGTRLPYHAGEPADGSRGTVVFSAYPLGAQLRLPVFYGAELAQVLAPKPFWVLGVHASQPLREPTAWTLDWLAIRHFATTVPGPRLVLGDFNATLDHGPVRGLLGDGFSDAARAARSGWQPTWPSAADTPLRLPFGLGLFALDHVLVSGEFAVLSTMTQTVAGTDHRALIARLRR